MSVFYLRRALVVLIALLIPPLLVLGSIRLLLTEAYLRIEYHKPDFPADPYGFTLDDRLRLAPIAMDYLVSGADIERLSTLTFPDGSALYNERELGHMIDVQRVIQAALTALVGIILVFTVISVGVWRTLTGRMMWRDGVRSGALLLITALVALVVYLVLDWDRFFETFHNLFFAEGSWTFSYSDTLIRLFPIRFWQDAAITVGAISGLGAILIVIGCWRWQVGERR